MYHLQFFHFPLLLLLIKAIKSLLWSEKNKIKLICWQQNRVAANIASKIDLNAYMQDIKHEMGWVKATQG